MKFLNINVELFKIHVVVMWECDGKTAARRLRRLPGGKRSTSAEWARRCQTVMGERCSGFVRWTEGRDVFIWLRDKPSKLSTYGPLVHELYHAVDRIALDRCHHSMTDPGGDSEARAYLFEFLFTRACRELWKD